MRISRKLTPIPALAALMCLLAASLHGEMLKKRISQGNNLGLGIIENWAGPMYTGSTANSIQFPKGSPNLIYNDCGLLAYAITRDRTGAGTPNDSIIPPDGDVGIVALHASIFNYDEVMNIAANEPSLGRLGDFPYDRVWSTLDPDEFTQWPAEGRWGRSASGDPITHGAETMFVHFGDVATTYGYGPPAGLYSGYSFYFLDYGESNNMVYINVLMQNVSEYLKYNTVQSYKDLGLLWPNGYKFYGVMVHPYFRQVGFGGYNRGNAGWGYHPAKQINAYWCKDPTVSTFSPPEPPIIGVKVLKAPSYNGETMTVTNVHTDLSSTGEFGVTGGDGLARANLSVGNRYKGMTGNDVGLFKGRTNPWTGRPMTFYPGLILPEDSRYNQWLWGNGASGGGVQACLIEHWGEIHDLMPRDTIVTDYVMMFSDPGVKPFIRPDYDLVNLDAPVMQQMLAPLETYADVAQQVFAGGLFSPETPAAPPLKIIPGDREITITWSDVNLRTPDSFYAILQQNGWDPNGYYREYDFEGYRLYRSFVGPNDLHAELIYNCNLTANNVSFAYVDRYDNDKPYYRMRNGMKIWYALVPYDKNYQVSTGEEFSLPDPTNSKKWNFSGGSTAAGLYQVVPRSDASNYKASNVDQIELQPAWGEPLFEERHLLAGDGKGILIDAPVYLAPVADFTFTPILNEKLTTAHTFTYETSGLNRVVGTANNAGRLTVTFKDGSYSVVSPEYIVRNRVGAGTSTMLANGPVDTDGMLYSITAAFSYMSDGDFRSMLVKNMDAGGYSGSTPIVYTTNSSYPGGYPPATPGQIRAGRFTLTWKDAGSGNLTLEVKDVTRNYTLNSVEYPDDYGWGFVVTSENFTTAWSGRGTLYDDMMNRKARAERTVKMHSTLPSSNTSEFGVWVNGILWRMRGTGGLITAMPSANTVFTLDNAWGVWNSAKTTFTQQPDPPFPGDKWTLTVNPSTTKTEDADFSKIRVVPNPYLASSFLDNASDQKRIEFTNLPAQCTIRIYTLGGNLVNVLNHVGADRTGWGNYTDWDHLTQSEPNVYEGFDNHSGTEPWNMRNRFGQTVASGLYFYHVTDPRGKTFTGRFYIIN